MRPPDTHRLSAEIVLDARRALWFEPARALVLADVHLGYAWAHRRRGQLLPLGARHDALQRMEALVEGYQPDRIVLLGDIVHEACAVPALQEELAGLVAGPGRNSDLILVAGNHDRFLESLLRASFPQLPLVDLWEWNDHRFCHGDAALPDARARLTVMGHEHPAVSLGDGVTHCKRCPCFLVAEDLLVLPAFSSWAAGSVVRRGRFLSPLANGARFTKAVAILGSRLLPVPLEKLWGAT